MDPMARTLYDKLWDEHVVRTEDDGPVINSMARFLLYKFRPPEKLSGLSFK